MLGKAGLASLHILHDALQVLEVTFRIEWISRNLKRDAILPADFFANIVKAALMERPISVQARSILFFTSSSNLKLTLTVCAMSNTPFLLIVYAKVKKNTSIFLYIFVTH
jgi:hypothetical protein